MKKLLIFKHLTAAVISLAVILSFSAGFSAQTVYKTFIELPTEASSGWKAESSVTLSANTVKKGEKAAVSFTSNGQTVNGEYKFSAQWNEFGAEVSTVVLKTDIFISDISLIKGGTITLSADDGHAFSWNITDLSLESGWNDITLNLRTADSVRPQEEQTDVNENEETEAETEEEPAQELTPDEILLTINKFAFEAEKNQEKELTVAFSGLSVSVPTQGEKPEPPEPITDEADQGLVTAAIIISATLIIAVFVYSAYYAKKEIKRRKREAKKRKREKMLDEQQNENEE